nr:QVPTGV class sortase B protein-sorting domain-containing protein [uncultured Oribacterium sp.]
MRKNLNKLATLALSGMMVMSMAVPAMAETSMDFTKRVHTDGQTYAPNTSFSFKVEKNNEASIKIGNNTFENLAVDETGNKKAITMAPVEFKPVAGQLGESDGAAGAHFDGKTKIVIDKTCFPKVGYYFFNLEENKGNYEGVRYNNTKYTIVVMKKDDTNTDESFKIIVQKTNDLTNTTKKVEMIENNYGKHQPPNNPEYPDPTPDPNPNPNKPPHEDPTPNDTTHDVIVTKKIAGSVKADNAKFKFTVKVESSAKSQNEMYKVVSYDNTDPQNPVMGSLQTIDNTEGKVGSVTFDNITENKGFRVYGLSKYDKVVVTEENGQTYTMTVDDVSKNANSIMELNKANLANYMTDFYAVKDEAHVQITNTKEMITPTGIVMNVAPYAMMLAVAGGLGVVFMNRKKEEE